MVAKVLVGVLGAAFSLLATFPVLFAGGDAPPASACMATGALGVELDAILATIRQRESGGDYQAHAGGSTASGAYQFTDGTWASYVGYAHAWQAPPTVQDAAAADHVRGILAANDDDPAAVPVVWYIGYLPAPGDPAWDAVPHSGAGNRLTPRQYQDAWLATYASLTRSTTGAPGSPDAPSSNPPGCVGADDLELASTGSDHLTTVEGITVDSGIARQVQQLIEDARRSGYQLTGSGYRSHERQIELRRAHCGTSNYAIYEMPSSQCSPPTARPGRSLHEKGLAIDFSCDGTLIRNRSSACFLWLTEHAPPLGLHNLPSEPWHFSTTGS